MNKIQLLPEHIVNQIKAGEVIERPASLIKELLENSIDAKADKISIHIKNNGLDLIAIEDNGIGISFEDLPYAFCRHATSKISRFDDLYQLQSYGFRGEALASISSISKITCDSCTSEGNGGKIVIHGGQEISHTETSSQESGTSLFITELFYNTPARLKFVKSQISEKNAIRRVLDSFLLSTPHIHWSIGWDDKDRLIFPKVDSSKSRIEQIFFGRKKSEILFDREEYDGNSIAIYVSKESSPGYSGKKQFITINNRFIIDNQIHRAIIRNLEHLWGSGQTGHYLVSLSIPPNEIDVNVHPAKTTVKFNKSSLVFGMISSALKKLKKEEQQPQSQQQFFSEPAQESKGLQTSFDLHSNESQNDFQFNSYNISEDFYILRLKETPPLLVKGSCLLASFIEYNLKDVTTLSDDSITPLLVSEPITLHQSKVDNIFPGLKNIGFELDRLDESTIVLRSLPTFLSPFANQIVPAFSNLSKIKNSQESTKVITELLDTINLRYFLFEIILNTVPLTYLLEKNIAKILDEKNLLEFYER